MAVLSHELRTPLNAILAGHVLSNGRPDKSERGLDVIERNAQRRRS